MKNYLTNLNKVVILCGPPASGKDTITTALKGLGDYEKVRLHRTGPRPKEGYIHVDDEQFEILKRENHFIEHHTTYGRQYGVSIGELLITSIKHKYSVIHLGSPKQALEIKKNLPQDIVKIIYLWNTRTELQERLHLRYQDNADEILRRMAVAAQEMADFKEVGLEAVDLAIKNNNIAETVQIIHECMAHEEKALKHKLECASYWQVMTF